MRWFLALMVAWLAAAGAAVAQAPPEQSDAYIALVRAEAAEREGDLDTAIREMAKAFNLYKKVAESHPDWNREVIAYRIAHCRNELERLRLPPPVELDTAPPPPSVREDRPVGAPDSGGGEEAAELARLQEAHDTLAAANQTLREELDYWKNHARALEETIDLQARELDKPARRTIRELQARLEELEATAVAPPDGNDADPEP